LYVTAAGDSISQINAASGNLVWMIKGIGGHVECAGDYIVAGPSDEGKVVCISKKPELKWSINADFYHVFKNTAIAVKGSIVRAYEISTGNQVASCHLSSKISTLSIDPSTGIIYAGTSEGKINVISHDLHSVAVISAPGNDPVLNIHTFRHKKNSYITAYTEKRLFCADLNGILWSKDIDNGKPIQMFIMDARLYVVSWNESEPCGGLDTGYSCLSVCSALAGEEISSERISTGYVFGPIIDIKNSKLIFTNHEMSLIERDISSLKGIKPVYSGTKIID
jgi:outer membrane protein assembly factor BamB